MMASLSGTLATIRPGVPYAIAAEFFHPNRPVVAMVGDGAMQMNGLNGLITIAKYWKEWNDPRRRLGADLGSSASARAEVRAYLPADAKQ